MKIVYVTWVVGWNGDGFRILDEGENGLSGRSIWLMSSLS